MRRMQIEMEQIFYFEPSGITLSGYLDKWLIDAKPNLEYKTYRIT